MTKAREIIISGGAEILPAYKSDLFVGREKEINLVTDFVNQLPARQRVLRFNADPGAGSSFFLKHLSETVLPQIKNCVPLLICLGETPAGQLSQNALVVEAGVGANQQADTLLKGMNDFLGIQLPPKPLMAEKVDAVRRFIQARPETTYVFAVDDFNANWDLLGQLEIHMLGNLLSLNNIRLVVAEKGRPYPAKNPFIIEAIRADFGPLSVEETVDQLALTGNYSELQLGEIHRLGKGFPQNNILLAQQSTSEAAVAYAYEFLLAGLSGEAQQAMAALALTGSLHENFVAQITGLPREKAVAAVREVNAQRMVNWKDGQYQAAESLAVIINHYLQYHHSEQWAEIHRLAEQAFLKEALVNEGRFAQYWQTRVKFERQAYQHYKLLVSPKKGVRFKLQIGNWTGKVEAMEPTQLADKPMTRLKVLAKRDRDMPEVLVFDGQEWFVDPQVEILPDD
jgi:hypothetical protein